MATFVFGMNQSLDGFVDHMAMEPDPTIFQHFVDQVRGQAGSVYGRRMYDLMRYWDEDQPTWTPAQHEYAKVWRRQPKWVVSRTLKSVGPNATLIEDDVETALRRVKADNEGEIYFGGTDLARNFTRLIDAYRLYFHPIVLGSGTPFFAGPRPPLRLTASDRIGERVIRLTYVPA